MPKRQTCNYTAMRNLAKLKDALVLRMQSTESYDELKLLRTKVCFSIPLTRTLIVLILGCLPCAIR